MHIRTQDHLQRQLLHQQAVIARAARVVRMRSGFKPSSRPCEHREPSAEGPPPAILLRPPLWRGREFADQGRCVRSFGIRDGEWKSWCSRAEGMICGHGYLIWGFGRLSSQGTSVNKRSEKTGDGGFKSLVREPLGVKAPRFANSAHELSSQNILKTRKPQCYAHCVHIAPTNCDWQHNASHACTARLV